MLRMASKRDYYDILGVSKGASEEDLKKAYRKLAREHHPDMVQGGDKTEKEERFKEINEAYQILSDPQKRKMYDTYGHSATQGFNAGNTGQNQGGQWGPFNYTYTNAGGGAGENPFGSDFDPFSIFEDFFGFRGFGGQRQPRHGKNIAYQLEIDFVDAVKGAEKSVKVESGPITIKIPKGARDGTELRFAGRGMPGPNNTPAGDLFITLRVKTPRDFAQRAGDDLGMLKEVDFATAILGGQVEVMVVDPSSHNGLSKKVMKIPSGTQHGSQIKLRSCGMPRLNSSGQGDLIVQVSVIIPTKISKKQKELLEDYQRS